MRTEAEIKANLNVQFGNWAFIFHHWAKIISFLALKAGSTCNCPQKTQYLRQIFRTLLCNAGIKTGVQNTAEVNRIASAK